MEYLKSVFDLKRIKLLISGGVSLLLGLLILFIACKVTAKLDDQYLAKRWGSSDNSYAQVSAFLSEMSGFDENSVKELEYKIENKLVSDSISTKSEDGRLWVYCYSANGTVTVSSESESVNVKAIGVGGDFFLFHPFEMVEGSFFDSEYVMDDLVVIDTDTAWKLFGSNSVVGQIVEIGGVPHVICGVVRKEEGRLNDLAGNDVPILFLSYASLRDNGMVSYINSFEALIPDLISDYAKDTLESLVPCDASRFSVIENTGRFHWVNLLKNVKNFGTRGMNGKGIVFPYWENLARGYEDYLTPVSVIGCLLFLYPCGLLIYFIRRMWKKRTFRKEDVRDFAEGLIEDYRERRKQGGKDTKYEEDQ